MLMSRALRSLLLALGLSLVSPAQGLAVTLDFEDLTLGTPYTFGALFTTHGVLIDIEAFQLSGGGFAANFAQVDGNQSAGGSSNDLELNNVLLGSGLLGLAFLRHR